MHSSVSQEPDGSNENVVIDVFARDPRPLKLTPLQLLQRTSVMSRVRRSFQHPAGSYVICKPTDPTNPDRLHLGQTVDASALAQVQRFKIAVFVLTCPGFGPCCVKTCGCRIEPCYHRPCKYGDHKICPCGLQFSTKRELVEHRRVTARTPCCANGRICFSSTPPTTYRSSCRAHEVWVMYSDRPNVYVCERAIVHSEQRQYASGLVAYGVPPLVRFCRRQDLWRREHNWRRRRVHAVFLHRVLLAAHGVAPGNVEAATAEVGNRFVRFVHGPVVETSEYGRRVAAVFVRLAFLSTATSGVVRAIISYL